MGLTFWWWNDTLSIELNVRYWVSKLFLGSKPFSHRSRRAWIIHDSHYRWDMRRVKRTIEAYIIFGRKYFFIFLKNRICYLRSCQIWHTPEQRVAASSLRRYSFSLRLTIAQTDAIGPPCPYPSNWRCLHNNYITPFVFSKIILWCICAQQKNKPI